MKTFSVPLLNRRMFSRCLKTTRAAIITDMVISSPFFFNKGDKKRYGGCGRDGGKGDVTPFDQGKDEDGQGCKY